MNKIKRCIRLRGKNSSFFSYYNTFSADFIEIFKIKLISTKKHIHSFGQSGFIYYFCPT